MYTSLCSFIENYLYDVTLTTPLYVYLRGTYYEKGIFSFLSELARYIFYGFTGFFNSNKMNIFIHYCICFYGMAYIDYDFFLQVLIITTAIFGLFFSISLLTYALLITQDLKVKHPVLFWLCLIGSFVLFILSFFLILYIFSPFIFVKPDMDKDIPGPSSSKRPSHYDPNPKKGPNDDPFVGSSDRKKEKEKEKEKQKYYEHSRPKTPNNPGADVETVTHDYLKDIDKIYNDKSLSPKSKRIESQKRLNEYDTDVNKMPSQTSSDEAALESIKQLNVRLKKINDSKMLPTEKAFALKREMDEHNTEIDLNDLTRRFKIDDLESSGHTRAHKSMGQAETKKTMSHSNTSPNLRTGVESSMLDSPPRKLSKYGYDGVMEPSQPHKKVTRATRNKADTYYDDEQSANAPEVRTYSAYAPETLESNPETNTYIGPDENPINSQSDNSNKLSPRKKLTKGIKDLFKK